MAITKKGVDIKRIRMDNGGEYMGKEFREVCEKLGITHKTTSLHMPEHNRIAKHHNRTLQEGALTL